MAEALIEEIEKGKVHPMSAAIALRGRYAADLPNPSVEGSVITTPGHVTGNVFGRRAGGMSDFGRPPIGFGSLQISFCPRATK